MIYEYIIPINIHHFWPAQSLAPPLPPTTKPFPKLCGWPGCPIPIPRPRPVPCCPAPH